MKEYLLLRNNTELGHYSLEELKTLGLKPYDLVWIENKSFSWKYPSEITELASFAPPVPLPSLDDPEHPGGRLVQMVDKDWLEESDDDASFDHPHPVERSPSFNDTHIVAFKPRLEQLRIKTIKSPVRSGMVKVEVRNGELPVNLPPVPDEVIPQGKIYNEVQWNNRVPEPTGQKRLRVAAITEAFYQLGNNNRMEMIVLVIGAISLLAVIYLFLTAGY
ncbi:MAG: hypothetical protein M9933_12430 [Chitinophagaceae bacterium]|nr:hypothetical protein [Chitinophagaceae bacterium]